MVHQKKLNIMCTCQPPQPQNYGQLHNAAMDYLYSAFSQIPLVPSVTTIGSVQIISTCLESLGQFYNQSIPNFAVNAKAISLQEISVLFNLNGNLTTYQNNNFNNLFFSTQSQNYISQLQTALNENLPAQQYISTLTGIYNALVADTTVPNRESEQMQAILQIGIYSCQYWSNTSNQTKWSSLFTNQPPPTPSYTAIWKADAAGAVGGAVRGAILCIGGPIGWGAFGLGVLAGAGAASAGAAVLNWLN